MLADLGNHNETLGSVKDWNIQNNTAPPPFVTFPCLFAFAFLLNTLIFFQPQVCISQIAGADLSISIVGSTPLPEGREQLSLLPESHQQLPGALRIQWLLFLVLLLLWISGS